MWTEAAHYPDVANGMQTEIVDYKNRTFTSKPFIDRNPAQGPGWYVWAYCSDPALEPVIKVVGRPNLPKRRHPHYSMYVNRGWLVKRDAEKALKVFAKLHA